MWRKFCGFLLKALGWKADSGLPPEDKIIILGAPHTSLLDFVVAYLFYESVGGNARCMVKKEMFFPPLSWILKAMGGIPIDRKNPARMIHSLIHEIRRSEKFALAIAPEGTRQPVKRWKAGFHLIAKQTGLPVYLGYFDWGTKHVGYGVKFEISDDAGADIKRIQEIYESMNLTARHSKKYITH